MTWIFAGLNYAIIDIMLMDRDVVDQKLLSGLSDAEVEASRAKYGVNEIEQKRKLNLIQRILHIFAEPMFLLLIITASIYFILGEVNDGLIMLVCVFFVIGIEFFQEQKTDKALEALNTLSSINIHVIRNGKRVTVDSKDLVVGDIVLLEEGDKIPADGVILELQGLGVNESALTGESEVVYKKLKADSDEHYKLNMCYAGCDVTNGTATIMVSAVGRNTEYGKIGNELAKIKRVKTPLEKQIKKLIVICSIISLTFCLVVVVVNFFYNQNLELRERLVQSVLSGITMAMATIPEEIPVVLTVFLAMGAWKLAKQQALTKNTKAVETLGAVTVLCTDKTGTLTQNKMTVEDVFAITKDIAKIATLACRKTPYDPMEIAIREYAERQGVNLENYNAQLVREYAFNNEDKMMGQIWEIDGHKLLCVKGAYENVLPLCNAGEEESERIIAQANKFSESGYRVLAVAKQTRLEKIPENLKSSHLEFVGLLALVDPPRQGVKESVEACHSAGVRIIMITGDNGKTAEGVARQIGLRNSSEVITGIELERMSDDELAKRVRKTNIFARVYPEHKMRIVKALQNNHEVVAMTGDGVNDAPALKKAEIGIAMGLRGTNVAKEAADLILLDDNFNTIVGAIANGRTIYRNIKKAIEYILVVHIPIILCSLFVPLVGLPLLLLPVHIVLLELIIDPTSSIIFQRLKAERDVMSKPPRNIKEPLLNKFAVIGCILKGTIIFLAMFASYAYLIENKNSQALAATFAFSILVLSNVFMVYVLQSEDFAIKNFVLDLKDKVIVLINSLIIIVLLLLIYVPWLNKLVGMVPLKPFELLLMFCLTLLLMLGFDLLKWLARKSGIRGTSVES